MVIVFYIYKQFTQKATCVICCYSSIIMNGIVIIVSNHVKSYVYSYVLTERRRKWYHQKLMQKQGYLI